MIYDVFISHSTRDKTAADAACAALEAAGIRCWIAPRDITPGAEWGEAIIEAINQCRVMVLIFSTNANESSQIRREVERALLVGTRSADHIRASGHNGCIAMGQASTRKQAGYMAAPERFAKRQIHLAPRAPSIHGPYDVRRDATFW